MSIPRADELDTLRAVRTTYLPERGTIARTGHVVPCRVASQTAPSPDPLAPLAPVVQWKVTVPDGTDIIPTDSISVPVLGTFVVVTVKDPTSNSTAITTFATRESGPHDRLR